MMGLMKFIKHGSIQRLYSSTPGNELKLCIIGGGPAGFYAAQQLLKLLPSSRVDMYERLPVPFGLVRFGVAPDHPDVKNVINTFNKTAKNPNFRFFGNCSLGRDYTLEDLQTAYHAVMLSYGAEEDNRLGIDGEHLKNVIAARSFVGWYNGVPSDRDLTVDLSCENVTIVGQGNVAVDVARILLTPVDKLKTTDITEYALAALAASRVKNVTLMGRRGPLHVAFTVKELRELLKLPNIEFVFSKQDFVGVEESIPDIPRQRKRLIELLAKAAKDNQSSGSRKLHFVFKRSPLSIKGQSEVTDLETAVNKLEGQGWDQQRAVATEETEIQPCGLLLRSIGYRSVLADVSIPFDSKGGTTKNDKGYISPGLFSCGWLSSGPVGVILSTMTDAFATAHLLNQHVCDGRIDVTCSKPGADFILERMRNQGKQIVTFSDWERIDAEETNRGKQKGKPREKIVSISEMLRIAASS